MMQEFKNWLKRPFSDDMSAAEWFYFFGLVIAISVAWSLILRTITNVLEENS